MKQQQATANIPLSDHYLSAEQLDFFYRLLSSWRQQLQNEHSEARQRMRCQNVIGSDIIDRSIKEHSTTMEVINYSRKRSLLDQVEAAMQRIENGTYGYCLLTDEEIGLDRLRSHPVATLSVESQELLERHRHRVLEC